MHSDMDCRECCGLGLVARYGGWVHCDCLSRRCDSSTTREDVFVYTTGTNGLHAGCGDGELGYERHRLGVC